MRQSLILFFVAALVAGAGLSAHAEVTAEDAAKYRQFIMRALSGHNGAVSLIARGRAGNPDSLEQHTDALAALAAEIGPAFEAFAGVAVEDSEALPAIWEEPGEFETAIERFAAAVGELDSAAAGGDLDAVDAAHREVGEACKACHEDFRLDD